MITPLRDIVWTNPTAQQSQTNLVRMRDIERQQEADAMNAMAAFAGLRAQQEAQSNALASSERIAGMRIGSAAGDEAYNHAIRLAMSDDPPTDSELAAIANRIDGDRAQRLKAALDASRRRLSSAAATAKQMADSWQARLSTLPAGASRDALLKEFDNSRSAGYVVFDASTGRFVPAVRGPRMDPVPAPAPPTAAPAVSGPKSVAEHISDLRRRSGGLGSGDPAMATVPITGAGSAAITAPSVPWAVSPPDPDTQWLHPRWLDPDGLLDATEIPLPLRPPAIDWSRVDPSGGPFGQRQALTPLGPPFSQRPIEGLRSMDRPDGEEMLRSVPSFMTEGDLRGAIRLRRAMRGPEFKVPTWDSFGPQWRGESEIPRWIPPESELMPRIIAPQAPPPPTVDWSTIDPYPAPRFTPRW